MLVRRGSRCVGQAKQSLCWSGQALWEHGAGSGALAAGAAAGTRKPRRHVAAVPQSGEVRTLYGCAFIYGIQVLYVELCHFFCRVNNFKNKIDQYFERSEDVSMRHIIIQFSKVKCVDCGVLPQGVRRQQTLLQDPAESRQFCE